MRAAQLAASPAAGEERFVRLCGLNALLASAAAIAARCRRRRCLARWPANSAPHWSHTNTPAAGQQLQRQQQQQQQLCGGQLHAVRRRRPAPVRAAQQGGGFGDGVKRMAKQITGNLPVIGLISRWASTEGGVGNDSQVGREA